MGSYFTRTRAWVYIAFYDEYVGRHINTSAGLSVLFFIPLYLYGIQVNRICESNANHYYYNMTHFDKRNRLVHNLAMEHFEMHKEDLEDLIVDMNRRGPRAFAGIPVEEKTNPLTVHDVALIDEVSGLNRFLENFMLQHNLPEATKARIKAHMFEYNSPVPKEIALQQMRIDTFGPYR